MSTLSSLREKVRSLARAGAFYITAGSFLTKFVSFFASIFIVRVLSKADYGVLGYMENISAYLYILLGFGLAQSILRYVVLADSTDEKYGYYKFALKRGSLINVALVAAALLICFLYPFPDQFDSARYLLPILILALPFHFLTDCCSYALRAMFDNKVYAIAAFMLATVLIYGKFFMAKTGGLTGAVVSQLIVYMLGATLLLRLVRNRHFKQALASPLAKDSKHDVTLYSIQCMITNGVWSMFMLNDVFLLGLLTSDPIAVAEYKVAYVLPANIAIICSSIGIFVAPYFIKKEADKEWVWSRYKKVLLLSSVLMGAVAALLILFAEPVITLLYGEQYRSAGSLMRLLLLASFVNSALRYTTANLLSAMGKIRINMCVSIMGVIAQVCCNVFMIPMLGAKGLAYTSIAVYSAMALALFVAFCHQYRPAREATSSEQYDQRA